MANDKFKNFQDSEITTNFCEAVQRALLGFGGRGPGGRELARRLRAQGFLCLAKDIEIPPSPRTKTRDTRPVYFAGLKVFDTHILFGRQRFTRPHLDHQHDVDWGNNGLQKPIHRTN